ncbi:uncharacterized protein LOC143533981 [Bidens hawaiensis]|uniref:uncharacterized protein LOC143533981 n=1 Tax=Bidens hawaiensis TaxID=980011 RepID=UPI004048EEDE
MEFWVVAAATGAGYVAKHWQKLSGEKDTSPGFSARVQRNARQVFDKMPDSETKQKLVGMNVQDYAYDVGGSYECCLHEFRANNSNRKPSSSLRRLVVSRDYERKQVAQVDGVKDQSIVFMEENEAPANVEFFEPVGSVKLPRKPEQTRSQGNDMVSLFLGITIGILLTIVSNKREIDHLNELLEQAENMVKDLHNKLEIKDGFNTTNKHDIESNEPAMYSPKVKNFELPSDIEAELESELERLEENMQRLSGVVEIDSDFEADMARGDLNLDTLTWQLDSEPESDRDDTRVKSESTGKPFFLTPNYTVSSLDLRLRLHEVIESELRARIEELEAVLQGQNGQSQTYSDSPELKEDNSFWDFDHTRIESSSSTP